MRNIHENLLSLIGKTPLVKLQRVHEGKAEIYAKREYFNPGGSVKDRIALAMIEAAEREGLINEKTVIIEPTSGNTALNWP